MAEDLILTQLGPDRVVNGNWYTGCSVPAYSVGRNLAAMAIFTLAGNGTDYSIADAQVRMLTKSVPEPDFDAPSAIYGLVVPSGRNYTAHQTVLAGRGYLSTPMAQHQEQQDRLQAIYGLPAGAIERIPASFNGTFKVPIQPLHHCKTNAITNPHLIRTTALLNKVNIMNGIVPIPREVCIADGRFRVWQQTTADEPTPDGAIHHWYVIPPCHILALHLAPFKQWDPAAKGVPHPVAFETDNGGVICYALADTELYELRRQVLERWTALIAPRPLSQLAFSATIVDGPPGVQASLEITANLTYCTWPAAMSTDEINRLMPQVDPELAKMFEIV